MNHLDFIMAFEQGEVDEDELVAGFQAMIDDGTVWQLQGIYGRTAARLIETGLCTPVARPDMSDLDRVPYGC